MPPPRIDIRKGLFLLAFSCCLSSCVEGQIQWEPNRVIALDNIPVRTDTLLVFPFRNLSDRPITVDNIRTVCGCTTPEWSPTPVMPGELGEVRVVLRPDRRGGLRKDLKVWFRGLGKPETLTIRATAF